MLELEKYFVRIDLKEKTICEGMQILPHGTHNISGFCYLPEEILEDLTEYGFENTGYINIFSEKINEYVVEEKIIEDSKNTLRKIISDSFETQISFGISFKGSTVVIDKEMKDSLVLKSVTALRNKDAVFCVKCNKKYREFSSDEILELCDKICVEEETHTREFRKTYDSIDKVNSFADFKNIVL